MSNSERTKQSNIKFKSILITSGINSYEEGGDDGGLMGSSPLDFGESTGTDIIDILGQNALVEISITEDMFAPSLSGTMTINDFTDFGSKLPLRGNELLWIQIQMPDSEEADVDLPPFHIYAIEEENTSLSNAKTFICYFVSRDLTFTTYDQTHLYQDGDSRVSVELGDNLEFNPNESDPNEFDPLSADGLETLELEGEDAQEESIYQPDGPEFTGYIHEFVQSLLNENPEFDAMIYDNPLINRVERTTNKIWYRPQDDEYKSLRKDGPQKFLNLMSQLAENAYNEETNSANYVFYQDLTKWNFKSITDMIIDPFGREREVPDEKKYTFSLEIAGGAEPGTDIRNNILEITRTKRADHISLLKSGALISNFSYYRPRIDINKYPVWYSQDIRRYYYRVNCQWRSSFPAAIVGYEQIEKGVAQWRYAFAEVYLVFDYEIKKPSFKIKPIDKGGVRSWIGFGATAGASGPYWIYKDESSDPPLYDFYARPAFNTMEMGNDGYFDYKDRVGWEAPGMRIDTRLWEEGCFKIQPIRGSMGIAPNDPGAQTAFDQTILNNVEELSPDKGFGILDNVQDDAEVNGIYPVVDMRIYWDQEDGPQYFFTASNATDGECEPEDEDCKDEKPEFEGQY
jgi:hypothetical protein